MVVLRSRLSWVEQSQEAAGKARISRNRRGVRCLLSFCVHRRHAGREAEQAEP